ncbi:hypothetical protein ACSO1_07240 [Acinetobacter calcoaceticus]|nr:hypothetical protein ACSO1_07240 [Acinetobacter calcoaceticus]
MATTTHSTIYISRTSNYEGDGTDDKEEFIETCNIHFKDQKAISTLSETEKKYFDKCVSASNDKYAAEEVIYDLGVGFAILIVLLGIGWGFYEAKKSLNTPMILNPKKNPENDANGDHISDGIIIVFISVIIAAFIYLIFSFVSGIWISIKY